MPHLTEARVWNHKAYPRPLTTPDPSIHPRRTRRERSYVWTRLMFALLTNHVARRPLATVTGVLTGAKTYLLPVSCHDGMANFLALSVI